MNGKDIIIQYGNRPSMYFNHDTNELTLELINQPDNNEVVLYRSSSILYQRWNHVVINNSHGEVDLFINSNLVGNYKNTISYSIESNESQPTLSPSGVQAQLTSIIFFNSPVVLSFHFPSSSNNL